jgi:UDP-N-acetyl-D-glucosamine dehydrogenase
MDYKENILQKAGQKKVHVGIVGLGYVGLPLAVTFAGEGVSVTGFDNSPERVWAVNSGSNYIPDIDDGVFSELVQSGRLNASDNFGGLKNCDVVIICVPTPLDRFKKPDTPYIENACSEIARNMKPGTFICFGSTTYPTTTEDLILPVIEKESGLKHGSEFWLAFSPGPGIENYRRSCSQRWQGVLSRSVYS